MLNTIWDISNEDFIQYVKESKTYSELLKKCGYTNLGNNNTVKKRINLLNLSIEHFIKNIPLKPIKTLSSEIFIENSKYNNNTHIKQRLFQEYNWEYKCSKCGINEWQGKKISLELDHINGNNTDNRLSNLRLLCPNCHSQTPTFRVKNKIKTDIRKCTDCNITIYIQNISGYCKTCVVKYRKQNLKIKDRPSLVTLENDIKELKSYIAVGKKYNVSDNTIRKWIRKYNNEYINNLDDLNKATSNININD